MEPTPLPRVPDAQASAPAIHVSLSRVGVTNVEKVIRIGPPGAEQLYYAKLAASSIWDRSRRARTCRASRRS
jgi:GTP cyclohydrolase FolE2